MSTDEVLIDQSPDSTTEDGVLPEGVKVAAKGDTTQRAYFGVDHTQGYPGKKEPGMSYLRVNKLPDNLDVEDIYAYVEARGYILVESIGTQDKSRWYKISQEEVDRRRKAVRAQRESAREQARKMPKTSGGAYEVWETRNELKTGRRWLPTDPIVTNH